MNMAKNDGQYQLAKRKIKITNTKPKGLNMKREKRVFQIVQ